MSKLSILFNNLYNFLYPTEPEWMFNDRTIEMVRRYGIVWPMRVVSTSLTIDQCSFVDCSSLDYGGAIYTFKTLIDLTNTQFYRCSAKSSGACLFDLLPKLRLENCLFAQNKAQAISSLQFTGGDNELECHIVNTNFTQNKSQDFISALRIEHSFGSMKSCYFQKNQAKRAGCIYDFVMIPNERTYNNCIFLNNTSERESACFSLFHQSYKCSIKNCYFINNLCSENANSIVLKSDFGKIDVVNCTFNQKEKDEIELIYFENSQINTKDCYYLKKEFPFDLSIIALEMKRVIRDIIP